MQKKARKDHQIFETICISEAIVLSASIKKKKEKRKRKEKKLIEKNSKTVVLQSAQKPEPQRTTENHRTRTTPKVQTDRAEELVC